MATKALSGKVAIVTGGSKGIGRAISLRLAADGARVIVNYSSDSASAEETVNAIGKDQAVAIKADAGNVQQIGRLVDETIKAFGKLDIVIPCAGIMPLNELDELSEEEFDKVMNVNVKGPLFLTQVYYLRHDSS